MGLVLGSPSYAADRPETSVRVQIAFRGDNLKIQQSDRVCFVGSSLSKTAVVETSQENLAGLTLDSLPEKVLRLFVATQPELRLYPTCGGEPLQEVPTASCVQNGVLPIHAPVSAGEYFVLTFDHNTSPGAANDIAIADTHRGLFDKGCGLAVMKVTLGSVATADSSRIFFQPLDDSDTGFLLTSTSAYLRNTEFTVPMLEGLAKGDPPEIPLEPYLTTQSPQARAVLKSIHIRVERKGPH